MRLLLLLAAAAAAAATIELKAVDVCDGRRSVVMRGDLPLLVFDDRLPQGAGCILSILLPPGSGLLARLRYLAVRLFRPTPGHLDELHRRHGLCLEAAFSLRLASAPPDAPPLRHRSGCVSPEVAGSAWLFEDIPQAQPPPAENATTAAEAGEDAMVAQFVWRLGPQTAAAAAQPGLHLAFSVAPFFNCSSGPGPPPQDGSFVHCQGSGGLCVPKRLACTSPVVSYLECPGRALFASSVLDCAFYNQDVGFYLFLVLAGSCAICGVLGCLLVRTVLAATRAGGKVE